MPTSLRDLERDLGRALEEADRERAAQVRRLIAEGHPDTPAAAEASYKLGLDALFVSLDLDVAVEHFRRASKIKSTWSAPARLSLGLALFRQGKTQQAMFELRKVASQKPPTVAAAQAMGIIAGFHRQLKNPAEAERARAEELKLLEQLTELGPPEDRALAHFVLGMERKHEGRRDLAKRHLDAALAGPLDPTFAVRARAFLATL